MANDLQSYLKTVNTNNDTRAAAWDATSNATDSNDFVSKMQGVNLPQNVKADLWEGRFGKGYPSPVAPVQTNPSTASPSFLDSMKSHFAEAVQHPLAALSFGVPGQGVNPQDLNQPLPSPVPAAQAAQQRMTQFGQQPFTDIGQGISNLAQSTATSLNPNATPQQNQQMRQQFLQGARQTVSGAGTLALGIQAPGVGNLIERAAAGSAPAILGLGKTVAGIGTGIAASKGAKKVAQYFGASPDVQELAGTAGAFIPSVLGTAAGIRTGAIETEDTAGIGGSAFNGGIKAGVTSTPEAYEGRIKVGDTTVGVRIPKNSDATVEVPPVRNDTTALPPTTVPKQTDNAPITEAAARGDARLARVLGNMGFKDQGTAPKTTTPIVATPETSPASTSNPQPSTPNPVSDFLGDAAKRVAQTNAGQNALDDMENKGLSSKAVSDNFWKNTYYNMPASAQEYFQKYLKRETGFQPGDSIGTMADGSNVTAQDWQHIGSLVDTNNEVGGELEGTNRGLIASMHEANQRFGAANPEPAPAKALEAPATTQSAVSEATTPERGVSGIEDKIRPLVGQILQRNRLSIGDQVFHAADEAIRSTNANQDIHPDDKALLNQVVDSSIGTRLTPDQVQQLRTMQGATTNPNAKILKFNDEVDAGYKLNANSNQLEQLRDISLQNYMRDVNDPNFPQEQKDKLNQAFSEAQDGKTRFYLPTTEYPASMETPANHTEYPFGQRQLGSPVSPITLKALSEIGGRQPRDLFESRKSDRQGNISESDRDRLQALQNEAFGRTAPTQAQLAPSLVKSSDPKDQPLNPQQAEILSDSLGLNPKDVVGKSYNEIMASHGTRLTPQVGAALGSIEDLGDAGQGMSVGENDRSEAFREYSRLYRQMIRKAFDKRTRDMTFALKGHVADWRKQKNGAVTELDNQLNALSSEAKAHLPKELFNESTAGSSRRTSHIGTTAPNTLQPITGTPETEATTTILGTGNQSSPAAKTILAIRKEFPSDLPNVEFLANGVLGKNLQEAAAKARFSNSLRTFYSALKNEDPFALKKAIDALNRSGEQGSVGPDVNLLTPEQARAAAAYATDKALLRYEGLSDIELKVYRDQLHDPLLQKRLEESAPVEDSDQNAGILYQALRARYFSLVDKAGPSVSVMWNMDTMFKRYQTSAPMVEQTKSILRSASGARVRDQEILRKQWHDVDKIMEGLSESNRYKFIRDVEHGVYDPANIPDATKLEWEQNDSLPPMQLVANTLSAGLAAARDEVTAQSGQLENFIKYYMPRIWANVGQGEAYSAAWWQSKKSQGGGHLEGTSSFLKQREYEYVEDGIAAGLHLKTTNPVRLAQLRIEMLQRYSMAHKILNAFKDPSNGTGAVKVDEGEVVPHKYARLEDKTFNRDAGNGGWYAPEAVAKVFNNFVSQGLQGRWVWGHTDLSLYDAARGLGNLANQFQLSLSAFHGVETSINSIFTAAGVGLQQIVNERKFAEGIVSMLKSPAAPITDLINGSRVILNYANPTQFLDYADVTDAMERVNGRVDVDPQFRLQQWDRFKENWATAQNEYRQPQEKAKALGKALGNIVGSTLQVASWPIMNWWVPRIKMGAFMREARQVYSEYQGQPEDVIQRELQKRWDSIDNRFGQVVYDNLMIHKVTRDILAMVTRSPGWNIGTFREGFGGATDFANSFRRSLIGEQGDPTKPLLEGNTGKRARKPFKISTRTAYIVSMLGYTMMFGAIYTYMHTGQMPENEDYFFPRDGSHDAEGHPNRVFLKNYTYDYIALMHDPIGTLEHKASPTVTTLGDIISNKNFYGRQIRDPGDNLFRQTQSVLAYAALNSATPFTLSNMFESNLRNSRTGWQSAFAIMPAPRYTSLSPAERLAQQYYTAENPQGVKTEEALQGRAAFINLRNKYLREELKPEDIQNAIGKGLLKPGEVSNIFIPPEPLLIRNAEKIQNERAIYNIWRIATDREKQELLPTMISKSADIRDPQLQKQMFQELEDFSHKQ